MSGSLSTASLSDSEKNDVRRFLGFSVIGVDQANTSMWFTIPQFRMLEYRMNNLRPEELQQVRTYLQQLYPLELAVPSASDNLDTEQAAVWRHNANEVADRMRLFNIWRQQLANYLGVGVGPGLKPQSNQIVI